MPKSFGSIYKYCQKYLPEKDYNGKYEVLSTELIDFEGRQISTSVYKLDDPSIRYSGLKPSDFAFENQAAQCVEKKPCFCSLQYSEIESEIARVNRLKDMIYEK